MILVRHARPDVDEATAPRTWELGARGRAQASALRIDEPIAGVWASDEPKAIQTVAGLGHEVVVDPRFREVGRPDGWMDDHRARAIAYLTDGDDGWEPRSDVVRRFEGGLTNLPSAAVIGTHGLAMSLYVASVHDVDVVAFWTGLGFADAWRLDPLERV